MAALLKSVASAPPDQRRALGTGANALKKEIEVALATKRDRLEAANLRRELSMSHCPVVKPSLAIAHPLTILREEIENIFSSLGFEILHGPEAEDDYHNFEALNMPAEPPGA